MDAGVGKINPPFILEGPDDRLPPDGLGWRSVQFLGPGNLVTVGKLIAHQHLGIEGASAYPTALVRPSCKGSVEQCHGSGIGK